MKPIVHDSEHWTNGGTGLTNFPPHQFPIYLEAVKRHGSEKKFVISSTRMLGRGRDVDGGSIHYLGDYRTKEGEEDCGAFWRVFDEVKEEMRAVYNGIPA